MEPLEAMLLPWAQGVVSSNLAAPTIFSNHLDGIFCTSRRLLPVGRGYVLRNHCRINTLGSELCQNGGQRTQSIPAESSWPVLAINSGKGGFSKTLFAIRESRI